jgi:hypothetical protein
MEKGGLIQCFGGYKIQKGEGLTDSKIDGVNSMKVYYMYVVNITMKSFCTINLC